MVCSRVPTAALLHWEVPVSEHKSTINRMVERVADLLMTWRKGLLALFVLLTLALGYSATHTQLDPGFN